MAIDLTKVRELADGQRQVKMTAGWAVAEVLTECADEIDLLRTTLGQALGIVVEFGNLNGFRNLSNAELGKAVVGMAERIAEVLPAPNVNLTK